MTTRRPRLDDSEPVAGFHLRPERASYFSSCGERETGPSRGVILSAQSRAGVTFPDGANRRWGRRFSICPHRVARRLGEGPRIGRAERGLSRLTGQLHERRGCRTLKERSTPAQGTRRQTPAVPLPTHAGTASANNPKTLGAWDRHPQCGVRTFSRANPAGASVRRASSLLWTDSISSFNSTRAGTCYSPGSFFKRGDIWATNSTTRRARTVRNGSANRA